MQRPKPKKKEWKRFKEISIPWDTYYAYRGGECQRVLNLRDVLRNLDKPVQRQAFKLSCLTVLLLFKILFSIGYQGIAFATKNFKIYQMVGMKQSLCYKTIQNTMQFFSK